MDNFLPLVLGPALVAGGIVAYRGSAVVYVRSIGAAAATAGAVMSFAGLVNALSVSSG